MRFLFLSIPFLFGILRYSSIFLYYFPGHHTIATLVTVDVAVAEAIEAAMIGEEAAAEAIASVAAVAVAITTA